MRIHHLFVELEDDPIPVKQPGSKPDKKRSRMIPVSVQWKFFAYFESLE